MLQSSQLFQLTSSRREWREHPTQQRSRVMHFNSHPHEEDDFRACLDGRREDISTHILTKRMTESPELHRCRVIFQLTSSRRGWRCISHPWFSHWYFNSHPHEEDDHLKRTYKEKRYISTHILTKRMTIFKDTGFDSCTFQLTSSRRGWPDIFLSFFFCIIISTHILTKRMTEIGFEQRQEVEISTHILTKRMTHLPSVAIFLYLHSNSHPHEEDDVSCSL